MRSLFLLLIVFYSSISYADKAQFSCESTDRLLKRSDVVISSSPEISKRISKMVHGQIKEIENSSGMTLYVIVYKTDVSVGDILPEFCNQNKKESQK